MKRNKMNNKLKKLVKLGLLGLITVCIILTTLASTFNVFGINDKNTLGSITIIKTPSSFIHKVYNSFENIFDDIINFKSNANKANNLEEENKKLKEENIKLNTMLNDKKELIALKEDLNYVDGFTAQSMISGDIIEKNNGKWYKSFVINVGSKNGVKNNSIVINGDGVVGIVYSVSKTYCKVISLLDSKASVSFKVSNNQQYTGVLTRNLGVNKVASFNEDGFIPGYMFNPKDKISKNDLIVTSGMGLYPRDIPIGIIEKVTYDKNKSMKYVKVKPFVDFENLNKVSIIMPRELS